MTSRLKFKKIAKPVIAKPISELINKSISLAKFPEKLKEAQVVQKEQCSR